MTLIASLIPLILLEWIFLSLFQSSVRRRSHIKSGIAGLQMLITWLRHIIKNMYCLRYASIVRQTDGNIEATEQS